MIAPKLRKSPVLLSAEVSMNIQGSVTGVSPLFMRAWRSRSDATKKRSTVNPSGRREDESTAG
jgi:hypothetical protein